jgi:transposase
MGKVFIGHDWAEDHHDVFIEDEAGSKLGGGRLPEGVEGIARFHEMLAGLVDEPGEVLIASETDRGLFINTLVSAGYAVIAVNPMSTSRYRERHSTSGAKSDPGDAKILADLARTDAHNHRRMVGDSELGEAIKVLARAHQSLIWTRQRQTNQLRSTLREFYPAALDAFDEVGGRDALAVLSIASTPTTGRSLSLSKIQSALRRGGRQRRIEQRAVEIQTALRAEQLAAPDLIADAMGVTVAALVAVIGELSTQIGGLEAKLADHFEQHPDAKIIRSLPGLGMTLGARVLAEFEPLCRCQVSQELLRHVTHH